MHWAGSTPCWQRRVPTTNINYSTLETNVICQTILILGLLGWGGGGGEEVADG